MGKRLAIKGHPTRGKEVIELLEMMGGINPFTINDGMVIGNRETSCYYISEYTATKYISWDYIGPEEIDKYEIFTLEEFLGKYPFKVGDKVVDGYGDTLTIKSMSWFADCQTMAYDFEDSVIVLCAEDLLKWNKMPTNKETDDMKLSDDKCEKTHEDVIFDSIIWHLRNSVNNGKQNLSGGECEDYFREVVKKNNENKMKNVLAELLEHIKTTPKDELEREFEEIEEWSDVGPTVEEFMDFCNKVNKKPKYPDNYEECVRIAKNIHGMEHENYIGLGKMRDMLMLKDEFISNIYSKHSKGVLDQKAVIEIMEENEGAGYWQDPQEVVEHGLADFIFDADEELEKLETPKYGLFYKIKKFFGYGG